MFVPFIKTLFILLKYYNHQKPTRLTTIEGSDAVQFEYHHSALILSHLNRYSHNFPIISQQCFMSNLLPHVSPIRNKARYLQDKNNTRFDYDNRLSRHKVTSTPYQFNLRQRQSLPAQNVQLVLFFFLVKHGRLRPVQLFLNQQCR